MPPFFLFTFLLVGLTASRQIVPLCSENEEFKECESACPSTCSKINSTQPTKCVDMCVSGCFCREGFVRDERRENRCVPTISCESPIIIPKCGRNEFYTECASNCITCQNPERKPCPCVQGCACQEGYIRDTSDGPCVPVKSCSLYKQAN